MLGVCVGAAIAGQRPIGEIQFNDFVATGFNQLVNNAAKIRYRWGGTFGPDGGPDAVGRSAARRAVPLAEYGGVVLPHRRASRSSSPSTPHDARALMASAVADPDPVLYYEHIALYRDPRIKQMLDRRAARRRSRSARAALRRAGDDLAIVSYGAFVHVGLRVAEKARRTTASRRACWICAVSLARSIATLCSRWPAAVIKVLIIHEDSRTGGIGESLAAIVRKTPSKSLDAPVRIVGALDTPVPYSPSLEEFYLPSEA